MGKQAIRLVDGEIPGSKFIGCIGFISDPELFRDLIQKRIHSEHVGMITDQIETTAIIDKVFDGLDFLHRITFCGAFEDEDIIAVE
jgi:hypothetical protein